MRSTRFRKVFSGEMDCDHALRMLRRIDALPGAFGGAWCVPAAFLCAAGFAAIFGALWLSIFVSGLVAALVQVAEVLIARFRSRGWPPSWAGC